MTEVDADGDSGIRLMSGGEPVVDLEMESKDLEDSQVWTTAGEASSESEDGEQNFQEDSLNSQYLSATASELDPGPGPEEKLKVKENIQATSSAFNQIDIQAKSCASSIQNWIDKVKSGEISTEKGLTFLEMKNHSLLNYIISLTGLILEKCSGKSIQGSSYLDQLIESRIILEKIRPIDQKLKYQIDKLVRIAVEGKVEMNDPLMFKANLDNLTSGAQEFDEGSDNVDELDEDATAAKVAVKGDGVYRPPKIAPQHYDEEGPKTKAGGGDGRKRPAINRTLIRELQEEYLETPVEVHNMGDAYAKRMSREVRDKQRFEESFMTRLPVTKKDKHKERSMSTMGVLGDELTDFSGKRARMDSTASKSKKKKIASKKGKGRGSKKRFRK